MTAGFVLAMCSGTTFTASCRLAGTVKTINGNAADAEVLFKRATKLQPNDLPAYEGLANLQLSVNKIEEAVQTYSHLVPLKLAAVSAQLLVSIPKLK